MKKDKYYEIAEKMYTEQFITVAGIAKRLGVNAVSYTHLTLPTNSRV